jgi:hypothetical protein
VLSGNFPPTDSIIMRYLLILNNEDMFWSKAVKHGVFTTGNVMTITTPKQRDKSLVEIFRELKVAGSKQLVLAG